MHVPFYKFTQRLALAALLLAFSAAAWATNPPNSCGNHGNNCNPQQGGGDDSSNSYANAVVNTAATALGGNAMANAQGGTAFGQGGQGGAGGQGGVGYGGTGFGGNAAQQQGQGQLQGQSQQQGIANSGNSAANAQGGAGGAGGNATNAGNQQATNVTLNEAEQPDDVTVRQAPTVMVSAPYATVACYKTGGFSISGILGGIGASGGKIDPGCELRETARVVGSFDKDAGIKVACLSELVQIALPQQCAGVPVVQKLTRSQQETFSAK